MTPEQDRAQMEAGLNQAIDDFMSYDEWQYAAREAVWKWMFERGWNERNKKVIELQELFDVLMSAKQEYQNAVNKCESCAKMLLSDGCDPEQKLVDRHNEKLPGPLFWIGVLCVMVLLTSNVIT